MNRMYAIGVLVAVLMAPLSAAVQDEGLSGEDILGLLQVGTDQREIIQMIEEVESVKVTDAQYALIKKAGASKELLTAIEKKRGSSVLEKAIEMVQAGKPDNEIIKVIMAGGQVYKLSGKQKLALLRAKASKEVIRALEGSFVYANHRLYKDPLGMLGIQFPQNWRSYLWYTGEGVKILLSPQGGIQKANEFTTGLQIQLSFLDKNSPMKDPDFDMLKDHNSSLDSLIRLNRQYDLKKVTDAKTIKLAGRDTVVQEFKATMVKTRCHEIMLKVVSGDVYYFMECVAPNDEFEGLRNTFQQMLSTFRPFPDRVKLTRSRKPMQGNQALDRYREAVVMIQSEVNNKAAGYGSGFFVRDGGYILTNHHVICLQRDHAPCVDRKNWRLATGVTIRWDAKVGPKREGETHRTVRATIEDTYYSLSPQVDIALLKAPPARKPYRTIPVSPISSGLVKEGDPVVALGFPQPGRMGIGNLFLTSGNISRVNYIERKFGKHGKKRDLNDMYTDTVINGGNSGGPSVNLTTGAVVGLNTYTPLNMQGKELEYAGVVLMDHILYQFPQIQWYPRRRVMSAEEHLELGAMLLSKGNSRAAEVEFVHALKQVNNMGPDQQARLYHQIYLFYANQQDWVNGRKMLNECLARHDRYSPALRDMAYDHAANNRLDRAVALIEKMIEEAPDDFWPRYYKADLYRKAKRYDDALSGISEAFDRGGDFSPDVHHLQGVIYHQKGDVEKSLASFKKAVKVDRSFISSRVEIAKYHERKNNESAAMLEYGSIIREFPGEPYVHESYGRYLLTRSGRREDALESMTKAVEIAIDRGERAGSSLLYDLGINAVATKKYLEVGRAAAFILHREWPGWRKSAHTIMGQYAKALNLKDLDIAHRARSGARVYPEALSYNDLKAMVQLRYSPLMMDELLLTCGLGFMFSKAQIDEVVKWPSGYRQAVVAQLNEDQLRGGSGLAGLLRVKFTSKVNTTDAKSAYADIEINNLGNLPLTGLRIKKIYKDSNNKILWTSEGNLLLSNPTFEPKSKRTLRFRFNSWETLRQKGLNASNIKWYSVEIMTARNGVFLRNMACQQGKVVSGKGYEFVLQNLSSFKMTKFTVMCEYVDKNGRIINDKWGRPLKDIKTWNVVLTPNQKTLPIIVKEWIDFKYLDRIGLPKNVQNVFPRPRVVDAIISPK